MMIMCLMPPRSPTTIKETRPGEFRLSRFFYGAEKETILLIAKIKPQNEMAYT